MPDWTIDEELLALNYMAQAQPADEPDPDALMGADELALWQEYLEEARAVLAHQCDPAYCEPFPCPNGESA